MFLELIGYFIAIFGFALLLTWICIEVVKWLVLKMAPTLDRVVATAIGCGLPIIFTAAYLKSQDFQIDLITISLPFATALHFAWALYKSREV